MAVVFLSHSAAAAAISVPADRPTIQAGINAAVTGDTNVFADGIYSGDGNRDVDFGGRKIVVKSANGPAFTTIVCNGTALTPHRGFNFHNHEDSTAKVIAGIILRKC